jgi:hypothetical protein
MSTRRIHSRFRPVFDGFVRCTQSRLGILATHLFSAFLGWLRFLPTLKNRFGLAVLQPAPISATQRSREDCQ